MAMQKIILLENCIDSKSQVDGLCRLRIWLVSSKGLQITHKAVRLVTRQ